MKLYDHNKFILNLSKYMYSNNHMNAEMAAMAAGEAMIAGFDPGQYNRGENGDQFDNPPVRGQKRFNKESMALPKNTKNSIVPKLDFKKSVDYAAQQHRFPTQGDLPPIGNDHQLHARRLETEQPLPQSNKKDDLSGNMSPVKENCFISMTQQDHYNLPLNQFGEIKSQIQFLSKIDQVNAAKIFKNIGGNSKNMEEIQEAKEHQSNKIGNLRLNLKQDMLCKRQQHRNLLARLDFNDQQIFYTYDRYDHKLSKINLNSFGFKQINLENRKYETKTAQISNVSENGQWLLTVQSAKSERDPDIEKMVQTYIAEQQRGKYGQLAYSYSNKPSGHEYYDYFQSIYQEKKSDKIARESNLSSEGKTSGRFDEMKQFFRDKKLQKSYSVQNKLHPHYFRLRRAVLERYRDFLIKHKGKHQTALSEFGLFRGSFELKNITLYNRSTGQIYQADYLEIQDKIEKEINEIFKGAEGKEARDGLIDINLQSCHVNNEGTFLVILIEIVIRDDRRNKQIYTAVCGSIQTADAASQLQVVQEEDHEVPNNLFEKQPPNNTLQGMITGFLSNRKKPGFLNAQSKKNMVNAEPDGQIQNLEAMHSRRLSMKATTKEKRGLEQPMHTRKSTVQYKSLNFLDGNAKALKMHIMWDKLPLIQLCSQLDQIEIKPEKAQFKAQNLESLIRVNSKFEHKFVKRYDPLSQSQIESLKIQGIHLVQSNYQKDQYFIEFTNVDISEKQIIKQNINHSKTKNENQEDEMKNLRRYDPQNYRESKKRLFSKIDYETEYSLLDQKDQLVIRMSSPSKTNLNQANMCFVAINSSYIFYTKLLFIKYDESQIALQIDLFSLISASEQPPTDPVTGKAQLVVDDACWTPDEQFVLVLLRGSYLSQQGQNYMPGTLCILPRLGVSFVRIFNPTRYNISRNIGMTSQAAKDDIVYHPQTFIPLIISEQVDQSLKSLQKYNKYHKKWSVEAILNEPIDNRYGQVPQKNSFTVFINNGGEQVFEFNLNYDDLRSGIGAIENLFGPHLLSQQESKMSKKNEAERQKLKHRNDLAFIRFCLTDQVGLISNPALLLKIPEMIEQWLPLYQYERIQDQYAKEYKNILQFREEARQKAKDEAEQDSEESNKEGQNPTSEEKKKQTPLKGGSTIPKGVMSGNVEELCQVLNQQNEEFSPVKVVAILQKFLTFCRWSDTGGNGACTQSESQSYGLLSLNFKQWIVTIINDIFFFLLIRGEPMLAYQVLQLAENYLGSRNDPTDYYLTKYTGMMANDEELCLQMEVNQVLINKASSFDLIVQSLRDPQGEIYAQSPIDHNIKIEQNLLLDLLPYKTQKDNYSMFARDGGDSRVEKEASSVSMNFQFLALKNLFQMQYIHLIFYCMIQFRNYQAASFNILFLVLANFISQRQIDPSFLRKYRIVLRTLISNYLKRKKTGDYEMFLGSADKFNTVMQACTDPQKLYCKYFHLTRKFRMLQDQVIVASNAEDLSNHRTSKLENKIDDQQNIIRKDLKLESSNLDPMHSPSCIKKATSSFYQDMTEDNQLEKELPPVQSSQAIEAAELFDIHHALTSQADQERIKCLILNIQQKYVDSMARLIESWKKAKPPKNTEVQTEQEQIIDVFYHNNPKEEVTGPKDDSKELFELNQERYKDCLRMLALHNYGKSESLPNYLRQKICSFLNSDSLRLTKDKNEKNVDDTSIMTSILLLSEADDYDQIMEILDKLTLQDGEILEVAIQIIQRRYRYLTESRTYFKKLQEDQEGDLQIRKQTIEKNIDPGFKDAVEQAITLFRQNSSQIQFLEQYKESAQSSKKSKKKKPASPTPLVLKLFGVTVNELGYATEDEDILKVWSVLDENVGAATRLCRQSLKTLTDISKKIEKLSGCLKLMVDKIISIRDSQTLNFNLLARLLKHSALEMTSRKILETQYNKTEELEKILRHLVTNNILPSLLHDNSTQDLIGTCQKATRCLFSGPSNLETVNRYQLTTMKLEKDGFPLSSYLMTHFFADLEDQIPVLMNLFEKDSRMTKRFKTNLKMNKQIYKKFMTNLEILLICALSYPMVETNETIMQLIKITHVLLGLDHINKEIWTIQTQRLKKVEEQTLYQSSQSDQHSLILLKIQQIERIKKIRDLSLCPSDFMNRGLRVVPEHRVILETMVMSLLKDFKQLIFDLNLNEPFTYQEISIQVSPAFVEIVPLLANLMLYEGKNPEDCPLLVHLKNLQGEYEADSPQAKMAEVLKQQLLWNGGREQPEFAPELLEEMIGHEEFGKLYQQRYCQKLPSLQNLVQSLSDQYGLEIPLRDVQGEQLSEGTVVELGPLNPDIYQKCLDEGNDASDIVLEDQLHDYPKEKNCDPDLKILEIGFDRAQLQAKQPMKGNKDTILRVDNKAQQQSQNVLNESHQMKMSKLGKVDHRQTFIGLEEVDVSLIAARPDPDMELGDQEGQDQLALLNVSVNQIKNRPQETENIVSDDEQEPRQNRKPIKDDREAFDVFVELDRNINQPTQSVTIKGEKPKAFTLFKAQKEQVMVAKQSDEPNFNTVQQGYQMEIKKVLDEDMQISVKDAKLCSLESKLMSMLTVLESVQEDFDVLKQQQGARV